MRKDESSKILSNEWKELIVEDEKTKEKLVIINSDGVEITSSRLSVRLVPKARINPDELKVLAKPLQEYLTSHFNPMCSVVVDVEDPLPTYRRGIKVANQRAEVIFEDEEGIKEITDDDYEVLIEKDSNKRVPIYLDCC